MFGYVRPCRGQLLVWELDAYKAVYCGLCRVLSKRYGFLARNLLQYDFVFFALTLDEPALCPKRKRCPVHPVRGCPAAQRSGALDSAADATVLMAYYKLMDAVRDGGFFKSALSRLLLLWLRPKYRKAAARLPETERTAREELERLHEIERARLDSIDAPAAAFARILSSMAEAAREDRRRPLASLLSHLGRWIYLVDAADDLVEDLKSGAYNPVAARFGLQSAALDTQAREHLKTTLAFSRSSALLALELMDTGKNRGVLENILMLGLPVVERRVLETPGQRRKTDEGPL